MSEPAELPNQKVPEQQPRSDSAEQSFDTSMKDISSVDASVEQSDSTSKMDISSSSIAAETKPNADYTPKPKKIKLSATESKLLKAEREQLRKEREELRIKMEQAKLEKEKERLEAAKLKLKQREEKEAEKEKKLQEAQQKKLQQELEKQEKLRQKEEERERKEREKKEKENERNQLREAKEKEKQRRQEEKQAMEDRKKQQGELEAKKLQKSRDVLFNFLKKSKSNADNNSSFSSESNNTSVNNGAPASLLDAFDVSRFEEQIARQDAPTESLYLNQLFSGKIKPYVAPQKVDDDCEIVEDLPENDNKAEKYVFLQFTENNRPAYFGKRLQDLALVNLSGRNPFKKQDFLDYEVDSDDEWVEEEPGESLSGSDSDEEKDKDDYQMDAFFVPHGYLSDDENKIGEANDPDDAKPSGPLLKEQALMAERNCKFVQKLCPQVVGCFWEKDKDRYRDKYEFLQPFKAVRIV